MNINNQKIQETFVTEQYLEAYPVVLTAYTTTTAAATATKILVVYKKEAAGGMPAPIQVYPLVGSKSPLKYSKCKDGKGLTLNPNYKT